jgi:hypothetical protein
MASGDPSAIFEIRATFQGGASPWARVTTLEFDAGGFRDIEGMGRSGDSPDPIPVSEVAALLAATFDPVDLRALFDQLALLLAAFPDSAQPSARESRM